MRALLMAIVVLGLALVAGDRVAVIMAQNEIGRKIAAEYNLQREPSVDIRGFPFLTQAVDGRYPDVRIQVGDWREQDISVRDLDVALTEVTAPLSDLLGGRTSNLIAATARATALVPYETVRSFAPSGTESISHSPDGLRVTGTFSVEGVPIPATVVVTVAPADNGFEVTPVSVQAAAGGPTISLALLRRTLTFTVPLQRLPLGARLTAITPGPNGLLVTAEAQDVHFSDLP
ncbi:LmeA family phospholipid-binding protein [Nocardia goodfellowii]